jgi:hypothetical protein
MTVTATVEATASATETSRKFDSHYADWVLIFPAGIVVGTALYAEGMLLSSLASITLDFRVTTGQVSPVMAMERVA